jgi:hypothetical protein
LNFVSCFPRAIFVCPLSAFPPDIPPLQLPSDKFQKSHKKFRMFDKNNDHHIGNSTRAIFLWKFCSSLMNYTCVISLKISDSAELAQGLASLGHHPDKDKLDRLFQKCVTIPFRHPVTL